MNACRNGEVLSKLVTPHSREDPELVERVTPSRWSSVSGSLDACDSLQGTQGSRPS